MCIVSVTFRRLPAPPQLLHSDVLVFTVQVAVFVGLLLLHVFYYELGQQERHIHMSVKKLAVFANDFRGGAGRLCACPCVALTQRVGFS